MGLSAGDCPLHRRRNTGIHANRKNEAEKYLVTNELMEVLTMNILEGKGLQYSYENKKRVLRGVNIQMEQGKMYAILGPSGCGKTTLLSLLGGLDSPTSGQILYQGEDIAKTGPANHRRNHVAFIFQSYNLIDYLLFLKNTIGKLEGMW